ncbi:MAG TPA: MazG nucleotide pyrophosphohydrolase domain-containing protein [Verrucomicrobiae bacterium]|nr:MazG nucleotide pyrophosphohydrolase domain-containing protein [Verrucomicrobiae bacterium]
MPDRLTHAKRVQRAAARRGFDWPANDPRVWDKLAEEIGELKRAGGNPKRVKDELGDLLFMVVNLARHLRVEPSAALAQATRKFERRFAYVMRQARSLPHGEGRLEAMEVLWQEAKRRERSK